MLRSTHEAIMEVRSKLESALVDTIDALKASIRDKDEQIAALEEILVSPKCNDYTAKPESKRTSSSPIVFGRGGWRARAELASNATIPAPADSSQALEQRVKSQGGKV